MPISSPISFFLPSLSLLLSSPFPLSLRRLSPSHTFPLSQPLLPTPTMGSEEYLRKDEDIWVQWRPTHRCKEKFNRDKTVLGQVVLWPLRKWREWCSTTRVICTFPGIRCFTITSFLTMTLLPKTSNCNDVTRWVCVVRAIKTFVHLKCILYFRMKQTLVHVSIRR